MSHSLLKTLLTQDASSTANSGKTLPLHKQEADERHPAIPAADTTLVPFSKFTIEIICRVCFKGFARGCLPLSSSSGFLTLKTIEAVLKNVIPEVNTNLIEDSCICTTCWNNIAQFYKLKLECLQNEQKFYDFLAKNGQKDDINVFIKQESVDGDTENETAFPLNHYETFTEDSDSLENFQERTIDSSESTVPLENPNNEQDVAETSNEKLDKEEDKIVSCSLCLTECKNTKDALCHTTESHGIHAVLFCQYCNIFCIDSELLKEHLLTTHNKEFLCTCGATFTSKQLLTRHTKNHPDCAALNKQDDLRCPYCSLVFEKKRLFNTHKRTHERKLYTCETCGKSHANNQLLEEHRFIHSNIKRFMCEKCGQCFKQKSVLWWHNYKYHINVKTKQCPNCPKKFFTNKEVKLHQIVHTKEKKYECHVCLKRFTQPGNVKRHMMIHTGEKYQCNKCGLTYSQIYPLKRHSCVTRNGTNETEGEKSEKEEVSISIVKASREPKGAIVNCKICDKVYNRSYIMYHMRTHTGEKPKICKVCGKAFATQASFARHMMIHTGRRPFKCEECDRGFIQKVDYDIHVRRKHTGEKPYECKVCCKSFVEFSILCRHRKTRTHLLAVENAGI